MHGLRLTEASIGILSLDPLTPVLAEEHVRGEGTLGCLGVFLTCTTTGSFLCFLDRLACLRASNISIESSNGGRRVGMRGRGVMQLTLDLVASLGI